MSRRSSMMTLVRGWTEVRWDKRWDHTCNIPVLLSRNMGLEQRSPLFRLTYVETKKLPLTVKRPSPAALRTSTSGPVTLFLNRVSSDSSFKYSYSFSMINFRPSGWSGHISKSLNSHSLLIASIEHVPMILSWNIPPYCCAKRVIDRSGIS